MTVDQVRRLLAQGEGIQLEFKEAKLALPSNFFETVCAFLNRDGGTILLGVEDEGTVCGILPSAVSTLKTNIANLSNNPEKLDPPCVLFPSHVQLTGKEVLCVQVLADSHLHRTRGVVYDRSEDGALPLRTPLAWRPSTSASACFTPRVPSTPTYACKTCAPTSFSKFGSYWPAVIQVIPGSRSTTTSCWSRPVFTSATSTSRRATRWRPCCCWATMR